MYSYKYISIKVWLVLIGLGVVTERSAAQAPGEYEVKAAFLYHFAQFIEWPDDLIPHRSSPIIYGILGEDPFGDALERIIATKKIHGRTLQLKRFKSLEDLEFCHVLFVKLTEKEQTQDVMDALRVRPILTVGETEQFVHQGGIINFVIRDNRVKFEVSLSAADRAEIRLKSQLLRLATLVEP